MQVGTKSPPSKTPASIRGFKLRKATFYSGVNLNKVVEEQLCPVCKRVRTSRVCKCRMYISETLIFSCPVSARFCATGKEFEWADLYILFISSFNTYAALVSIFLLLLISEFIPFRYLVNSCACCNVVQDSRMTSNFTLALISFLLSRDFSSCYQVRRWIRFLSNLSLEAFSHEHSFYINLIR